MATHGEYWLLFIQISQVLVYILNLCHKNKLKGGGGKKNEVARIWINEWLIEINRLLKKWLKLFAADVIFKSL